MTNKQIRYKFRKIAGLLKEEEGDFDLSDNPLDFEQPTLSFEFETGDVDEWENEDPRSLAQRVFLYYRDDFKSRPTTIRKVEEDMYLVHSPAITYFTVGPKNKNYKTFFKAYQSEGNEEVDAVFDFLETLL